MKRTLINGNLKAVVLITGIILVSSHIVGATEQNRFESFRDQLVSYEIDTTYDDGSPRFIWLDEPSTIELTIGSVAVDGLISVASNGYVSTLDFVGPHKIHTPAGRLASSGVTFHENGTLRIVHTGDPQPIATPVGDVVFKQYVRFFENGVPEELWLVDPVTVSGAFGELVVDEVLGFHPEGTLRSLQFSDTQMVRTPDGLQEKARLVNLHENGSVDLVQFAGPATLETASTALEAVVAAAYSPEGTLSAALLSMPTEFETPGGRFALRMTVFTPGGEVAGGLLMQPQSFETPTGAFPLLAVAFRSDGSIERAAPLEPRVIDGLEYSLRHWMYFDESGHLADRTEMSMF